MLALAAIASLDLSAASGLVEVAGELWVIADDELALAVYTSAGAPLRRVPLFAGALPDEPAARKAAKPDLEALCVLPGGAVLALGSGSLPGRRRGARIAAGRVEPLDLEPLYQRLGAELPELNIEGAAVAGDALCLLSRGNGAGRLNALIELDLAGVLAAHGTLGASLVRRIVPVELPDVDGVALGFTDAAPAGGELLLFAAAAEATLDPVLDGACAGSAIGLLDRQGRVRAVEAAGRHKIEGVTRLAASGELRLCSDADDRAAPATLFTAAWPWA